MIRLTTRQKMVVGQAMMYQIAAPCRTWTIRRERESLLTLIDGRQKKEKRYL